MSRGRTNAFNPQTPRGDCVKEACDAIKKLILSGEFKPGMPLTINALSRAIGISNTPIREAMRLLQRDQWIETIPYRGAFVRPFDEVELRELYELRLFLEVGVVRKVMPYPPQSQLREMEKAVKDMRAAMDTGDAITYYSADTRFHQALVTMAHNRRVTELFATLIEQGKCFMLRRGPDILAQDRRKGEEEHVALFEAIRSGQTRQALRLLDRHLQSSLAVFSGMEVG